MRTYNWTLLCSGLFAVFCLAPSRSLPAAEVVPQGAEILGRGPLHEAFAQPLEEQLGKGTPIVPKAPPVPIEELPPDQKPEGDAVQWVPGYWQWDDASGEFLWVSGLWREPPPTRKWIPGQWRQTEGGYQWSNGFWAPESMNDPSYQPPPPASQEAGPAVAAPSEDASYVPGLWVYRDSRYVWRPGYWLTSRPGWVWNPAHYLSTPSGSLFVPGYWDYPLEQRGVPFASVAFDPSFIPRVWTPSYTVSLDFLPGALFVRPGYGQYYYGDYFSAAYRRAGYTPWVDARVGRFATDPLFNYYRGANAGGPWERNLRGLYTGRSGGQVARPPVTLTQQTAVLRGATSARTNVTNLTVLQPLSQSGRGGRRLVTVDRAEHIRQQQPAPRRAVTRSTASDFSRGTERRAVTTTPRTIERAREFHPQLQQPTLTPRITHSAAPRHVEPRHVAAPRPAAAPRVEIRHAPPPPPRHAVQHHAAPARPAKHAHAPAHSHAKPAGHHH